MAGLVGLPGTGNVFREDDIGLYSVGVNLSGAFSGTVEVDYTLTGSMTLDTFKETPAPGTDAEVNELSGTLTFEGDGSSAFLNESILFSFIDDTVIEGDESVTITLTDIRGDATLDPERTEFTVTLLDNDGVGFIYGKTFVDEQSDGLITDGTNEGLVLRGVEVELLDANGAVVGTDVTRANDGYAFESLAPGDYRVRFNPDPVNPNLAPTIKDVGDNGSDDIDSDIDPTTFTTDVITLSATQVVENLSAGFVFNNPGPLITDLDPVTLQTAPFADGPQRLDQAVSFVPSQSFNAFGGLNEDEIEIITVSGQASEDRLSVFNEGDGPGQLDVTYGLNGGSIRIDGDFIASFAEGFDGKPLVIDFTTFEGEEAQVDQILDNITLFNPLSDPTDTRTLTYEVNAGEILVGDDLVDVVGQAESIVTIEGTRSVPDFSIQASVDEVAEGDAFTFTVTRSGDDLTRPVTLRPSVNVPLDDNFFARDLTSLFFEDAVFEGTDETEQSVEFTITTAQDLTPETDENIRLAIDVNERDGFASTDEIFVKILDDDRGDAPIVGISMPQGTEVTEGETAVFRVSIDAPRDVPTDVSVEFVLVGDLTRAGIDDLDLSETGISQTTPFIGVITIPADADFVDVPVPVLINEDLLETDPDPDVEDEVFSVKLVPASDGAYVIDPADDNVFPTILEIPAPNTAPVAEDDTATTDFETVTTLAAADLLGNDTDVDDDTLSITGVGAGENGTPVLNQDGSVTFTPANGFSGEARFTYTVSDGNGGSDTGDVAVNVKPSFASRPQMATGDAPTDMSAIRDFDGNDLGAPGDWKLIGAVDVQNDGDVEYLYINQTIERWATVGPDGNGNVDFSDHGQGGDTRVVGIYIDPLVESGDVEQFSDFDSQRRFQNDLAIDNLTVIDAFDFDCDGFQEVYFKVNDGTAYLRALMHADGNIQYANYQNAQQVEDYLTGQGFGQDVLDTILI